MMVYLHRASNGAPGKVVLHMKLAVPSVGEGGLDAQRSAHFGHADCFTILNIEDGKVSVEGTIANPPRTRRAAACAPSAFSPRPVSTPSWP